MAGIQCNVESSNYFTYKSVLVSLIDQLPGQKILTMTMSLNFVLTVLMTVSPQPKKRLSSCFSRKEDIKLAYFGSSIGDLTESCSHCAS